MTPTAQAIPDGSVVELLGLPPLANTAQAEDMRALLQNAEPSFGDGLLLEHNVHTDAARLVQTALYRERYFHFSFVFTDALIPVFALLFQVVGVETGAAAQVADDAVSVVALAFRVGTYTFYTVTGERTQLLGLTN